MEDEQQLVEALKNPKSKDKAFRILVKLYQVRLYHHIRSLLLNHDDANDVLQNTFIKVYQNIHTFKGKSRLFSWLYRIATNESLDFINQKSKRQHLSLTDYNLQQVELLPDDPLFDGDQAELLLLKAVATLPEKQQLVFKMKYFQDMDYQSMSEILQTSIGALKASYHHAVKKIETFLQEH